MKLTIKTLQQSNFKVDIEPDKTVKELKEKIENDHGKEYPCGAQKLIYSGKILADESKLSEYEIDEKKFIVLMITRPPPPPRAPISEKTSPVKKEETAASKTKQSEDKPKPAPSQTSTSSSSTVSAPASASVTAPTNTSTPQQTTANRPPGRPSANNEASLFSMAEPQMASRLAALMNQPHFRQIQDLLQQSPHLLGSTIDALSSSDPDMYRFMSENPDLFLNALNHPPLAGSRTTSSGGSATSGGRGQSADQGSQQSSGGGPLTGQQPVVDQIHVSEHDKEAIERLKELGFSEYLAVQAYMACDKDEQLAANLLFQMDQ